MEIIAVGRKTPVTVFTLLYLACPPEGNPEKSLSRVDTSSMLTSRWSEDGQGGMRGYSER